MPGAKIPRVKPNKKTWTKKSLVCVVLAAVVGAYHSYPFNRAEKCSHTNSKYHFPETLPQWKKGDMARYTAAERQTPTSPGSSRQRLHKAFSRNQSQLLLFSLPGEMADMPDHWRFPVGPFKVLDSLRKTPIQLLYASLPPQHLEPFWSFLIGQFR